MRGGSQWVVVHAVVDSENGSAFVGVFQEESLITLQTLSGVLEHLTSLDGLDYFSSLSESAFSASERVIGDAEVVLAKVDLRSVIQISEYLVGGRVNADDTRSLGQRHVHSELLLQFRILHNHSIVGQINHWNEALDALLTSVLHIDEILVDVHRGHCAVGNGLLTNIRGIHSNRVILSLSSLVEQRYPVLIESELSVDVAVLLAVSLNQYLSVLAFVAHVHSLGINHVLETVEVKALVFVQVELSLKDVLLVTKVGILGFDWDEVVLTGVAPQVSDIGLSLKIIGLASIAHPAEGLDAPTLQKSIVRKTLHAVRSHFLEAVVSERNLGAL